MSNPNLKKCDRGAGFIQIVLIVVGALVLLKYVYDIDVVGFLTRGKFREFLDHVYNFGIRGWEKYDNVIIKVWNYIIDFIKNLISKIK